MTSVLITAFEPYEHWRENASWLALVELTSEMPASPHVTTRRYPVDFNIVKERLAADLAAGYDYAIHLGQAPSYAAIDIEAIGVNVQGQHGDDPAGFGPLVADGPAAFRSALPLGDYARKLGAAGIPAQVSFHAGTYLCNATLYLSHYFAQRDGLPTRATFLHLPLAVSQNAGALRPLPSMESATCARAVRLILEEMQS